MLLQREQARVLSYKDKDMKSEEDKAYRDLKSGSEDVILTVGRDTLS